ncbi:hypothetical protein EDD36DRAFT_413496 [Exophiala viscosa]|uniref:Uncharacterized protein n=1 Tax=Exophiala viscosa TaxID=2486360 RepID=A0AAN6E438_9EURO|nr:hypothetical protein EDD36DRAFT_413496 [Exophiala viscosa]
MDFPNAAYEQQFAGDEPELGMSQAVDGLTPEQIMANLLTREANASSQFPAATSPEAHFQPQSGPVLGGASRNMRSVQQKTDSVPPFQQVGTTALIGKHSAGDITSANEDTERIRKRLASEGNASVMDLLNEALHELGTKRAPIIGIEGAYELVSRTKGLDTFQVARITFEIPLVDRPNNPEASVLKKVDKLQQKITTGLQEKLPLETYRTEADV